MDLHFDGLLPPEPAAQGLDGLVDDAAQGQPDPLREREANLEVSNALLDSLASTLVTSRMQRPDGFTTQRNVGRVRSRGAYDNPVRA